MVCVPASSHEPVLPRHQLARHDRLASGRQPPPAWPKGPVQDPPVLDLGQVNDAVWFDFDVVEGDVLLQDGGLLGREGHGGEALEGARPIYCVRVGGVGEVGRGLVEVAEGFGGGGEVVLGLGRGGGGVGGRCG